MNKNETKTKKVLTLSERLEKKRSRSKLFSRCGEGIKKLRSWQRITPVALLVVACVLTCVWAVGYVSPITENAVVAFIFKVITVIATTVSSDSVTADKVTLFLTSIITYGIIFLVIFLYGAAIMAILVCLGKPKDDKAIDDDVEAAFKLEKKDRYKRPFLIRYTELVGGAMEYVFYSRWIAIEKWQNPDIESDLLTALDRHKVEETCNGGKKHIIILHLGKGVQALERGVLYDDEV